jgi:hypothetical protein
MSTLSVHKVVVLGAGGSLGPAVLDALESHFDVTILTRKSSTSTFPPKFKTSSIEDDYPTPKLLDAFRDQDAVVSLISPWAAKVQEHIIDAAVEAGVKRFIPAEFGYDTLNPNAIALLPGLQVRVDVINHLKSQETKGLTWTAIATGGFFDWGLGNGFTGFDLANRKAMIYDDGDQPFSTSTVPSIGIAVARVLLHLEATQNHFVFISSFTTTQNEILAKLEKHSAAPWEITKVNSKAKIEEAREVFRNGGDIPAASRLLILAVQYTAGNGSDFSGRESNEVLGLLKENMDEVVKHLLKKIGMKST